MDPRTPNKTGWTTVPVSVLGSPPGGRLGRGVTLCPSMFLGRDPTGMGVGGDVDTPSFETGEGDHRRRVTQVCGEWEWGCLFPCSL